MSIRIKVFLIITGIILVITASSVVISVSAAQNEIIKTLESGMQSVTSVANEYISGELDLLMIDAATVVQALPGVALPDLHGVLMDQLAAFSDVFMAITIFTATGNVEASYGSMPTPASVAMGEFGQQAFAGKRIISTSRQDPSGYTVFHVFVPLDETVQDRSRARIAAFTVRGTYLSEKVNQFQIWGTGNIAILDREGVILANKNHEWVTNRVNFMDMVKKGSTYDTAEMTFTRILAGETGADRFIFDSTDAVTAYRPISTPDQKWFITVTTPLAESAYNQVRILILISGLIFLGLGMVAAVFASGSVAKPFYQIRKQNAQLIELGEAVKAAAIAKTNFLANMSYDMRTPLNAVIGLSELSLTKTGVPEDIRDYLKRIYGSGMTLMEVVSDLLDISNMESGKFGVIPAEYDLGTFVDETVKANAEHIGSKPVDMKIVIDEKMPARLIGDSLRLKQIFNNLLTNAIRYTSVGTVEWRISFEREGDSIWLIAAVSDTGVGIKPESMDRLFVDYNSRLDGTRVRKLEGASGLGLTLIKKIITLMDGMITVESTLGKGSTFNVRVRQGFVADTAISTEQLTQLSNYKYVEHKRGFSTIKRVQLPKTRVLVVDDVEINLEIAQGMLEPYSITVDCLTNAQEAVELIRLAEPQYDAIFMSRWMSELDGKEAVRIIREEVGTPYAKNIPIIALIATTLIGNKDVFHTWGFQDVLSKPLDIRHLDEAVNTWLVKK